MRFQRCPSLRAFLICNTNEASDLPLLAAIEAYKTNSMEGAAQALSAICNSLGLEVSMSRIVNSISRSAIRMAKLICPRARQDNKSASPEYTAPTTWTFEETTHEAT